MQLRSELDSIGAAIDAARLQVTQRVHGDTELLDLATAAHNRAKSEMAASERALEARCASFKATLQTARKLALDALAQAVNHALHLAEALAVGEILRAPDDHHQSIARDVTSHELTARLSRPTFIWTRQRGSA